MSNESEVLTQFFAISESQIANDMDRAETNPESVLEEMRTLRTTPEERKSPAMEARRIHLNLILASTQEVPTDTPEVRVFYAAWISEFITDDVGFAAYCSTYRELTDKLRAMRARDGLTPDQDWAPGDGPADYQAASRELDEKLSRVRETHFDHILRRYRFTDEADLFERDPLEFEIAREVGRQIAMNLTDEGTKHDEVFRKMHGQAALDRVKARVREIRQGLKVDAEKQKRPGHL